MINKTNPNQKRKTRDAEESIKARRKKVKKENSTTLTQNEKTHNDDECPGDLNS